MKKAIARKTLYIMLLILILGLILILSSSKIGSKIGDSGIERNGGMMDTSEYERIIDNNTWNFRAVGFLLYLSGSCGMFLSGFALYKEL